LIPELGDAVVSASAGAAAAVCGAAVAALAGPGTTAEVEAIAVFGGAAATGESVGTRDAGALGGGESDSPARLTLVDIFPARRATTAASTIPAATITMTNIS
jgi:hypothetical protein